MIEARECDLGIDDVPEEEIFSIEQFKDFRIKLNNGGDRGEIINFSECDYSAQLAHAPKRVRRMEILV